MGGKFVVLTLAGEGLDSKSIPDAVALVEKAGDRAVPTLFLSSGGGLLVCAIVPPNVAGNKDLATEWIAAATADSPLKARAVKDGVVVANGKSDAGLAERVVQQAAAFASARF